MSEKLFLKIPSEIVDEYIFPLIDKKIKILLSKQLYLKYHNDCYDYTINYLIFIVKKNIRICSNLLKNYSNFDIFQKKKFIMIKKHFIFCMICVFTYLINIKIHFFCNILKNYIIITYVMILQRYV